MKIDTILFDLDGTLVDSEIGAAIAVSRCFSLWGHSLERKDAVYVTGKKWEVAFDFLLKKYPVPLPRAEVEEAILDAYQQELDKKLHLIPGSQECVKALASEFRLALVSGSYRRQIHWALEQMGVRDLFEVILGAEDYPRSKPAPDGYLKALELMGVRPQNGLVFEDSTAGIASARAAGIRVVAITAAQSEGQDISAAHEKLPDLTRVDAAWVHAFSKRVSAD